MQTQKEIREAVRVLRALVIADLVLTVVTAVAVMRAHPEMVMGMLMAVTLVTLGILALAHRIGVGE